MRARRLRIRAPMPPPRERTLTPPIERPTTLPAASRIVEDIGDPASSLRAAQDGNTRRLAELQDVGYLLERVRDRNGCSLTHRAAGSGRLETLAWLLTRTGCRADHASDGGKKGARGRTPLHFAARHGHVACCRLLHERGALIDAETASGVTPLMWAGYYGSTNAAAWLLDAGADPLLSLIHI